MQASPAQTKVLDNMKHFHRLQAAKLLLLGDDQVNVHIRVDKVTVRRPAHRSLDPHQTMVLGPLKHRLGLQDLGMSRIVHIRADPTNVLAPSESPLPQTISAHVQSLRAATPQKHKTAMRCQFTDWQGNDLIPVPELPLVQPATSRVVLFQWRFYENDIELGPSEHIRGQLGLLQVSLQVHRWCGTLLDQIILQLN